MTWWQSWQLRSSNDVWRRRAIRSLGQSREAEAFAAVLGALKDESYLVRKEAARVLGTMTDARAVRPLVDLIEESFHYSMARTGVGALEDLLARVAGVARAEDLAAASILSDVGGYSYDSREGIAWFSESRNARLWAMDCSRIRFLAQQELFRRGPAA